MIARAACAVLAAGAVLVVAGCSAGSGHASVSASRSDDTYGALPTFLPTPAVEADKPVSGGPGRPAVTSQGDVVVARVGAGTVRATVLGPVVPGEGLPKVQEATTATWTVTLSGATAPVPVRVADFVALDDEGTIYRPRLVPGSPRPPSVIRPGARVSFPLRVVIATGEGVMRWQPDGRLVAVWDFVVEND
ncbi:hypothetical protein [Jatrophihabitans fulvus]